jgi:hypothetical protein
MFILCEITYSHSKAITLGQNSVNYRMFWVVDTFNFTFVFEQNLFSASDYSKGFLIFSDYNNKAPIAKQ